MFIEVIKSFSTPANKSECYFEIFYVSNGSIDHFFNLYNCSNFLGMDHAFHSIFVATLGSQFRFHGSFESVAPYVREICFSVAITSFFYRLHHRSYEKIANLNQAHSCLAILKTLKSATQRMHNSITLAGYKKNFIYLQWF